MNSLLIESKSLIYKTSKSFTQDGTKFDIYISIRLNDECKNGHQDFSITGDIYLHDKPKVDKYHISGGCIHDNILKHFPEFKIFVDLHLSQYNGVPMYAIESGFYHLKNSSKETALNYLRINENEYNILVNSYDKIQFTFLLRDLNIIDRWQLEANEAINILEGLTNTKFIIDSPKLRVIDSVNIDLSEYTPEKIKEKELNSIILQNNTLKEKVLKEYATELNKITIKKDLALFLIDNNIPTNNYIYYDHLNSVVFNWKNFEKKTSEKDIDFVRNNNPFNLKVETK